jgi:hypothetical protein
MNSPLDTILKPHEASNSLNGTSASKTTSTLNSIPAVSNESSGSVYDRIACDDNGNGCHLVYNPIFQEITEDTDRIPTETWEYYIKPNAGYQFNKMATGSAFVEYRYLRSKINDGSKNSIHTLRFEIALMLRFD